MKALTWDGNRRVNLTPRFFLEHPAWRCSPLATKLYLFLVSKANHPAVDVGGDVVLPGQFRRSLRLLAKDLAVKDPRFVRAALLELCSVGRISLQRLTPQPAASHAAASDAVRDRKSQLINVNGFNELRAAVASDAAESTSYGSTGRRRSNDRSSLTPDQRTEIQIRDRAQMRAERQGIAIEEALR